MKKITTLATLVFLSGCTSNYLVSGSTYESFDGKFIDTKNAELVQKNSVTAENADAKENSHVIMTRAAADKTLVANPYVEKYLEGILFKLVAGWDQPLDRPVYIKVSEGLAYSASATQDTIVITQGVLADAESEDEVAFIIAHELSHILLNHHATNDYFKKQEALVSKAANVGMTVALAKDVKVNNSKDGITLTSKGSDSASKLYSDSFRTGLTINRLSRDLISSTMSRGQEDEADLLGMDLLVKAGYSPKGFMPVLERVESSRVFTQEQLEAKQKEFDSFVAIAGDAQKHMQGSDWKAVATLGATKGASMLLQEFSSRHHSELERKKDMASYIKREYRSERRRPLTVDSFEKNVKSGKGNEIQENYWFASQAMKAVEHGDLDTAEKLARKSVRGSTKHHAYPRLAFYTVRKMQQQDEKAALNLKLIKNWDYASAQTFSVAAQSYRDQNKHQEALKILDKGSDIMGSNVVFLPEYIATHSEIGNQESIDAFLAECDAVSEQNIKNQCYAYAGKPLPVEEESSILNQVSSLTSLVDL